VTAPKTGEAGGRFTRVVRSWPFPFLPAWWRARDPVAFSTMGLLVTWIAADVARACPSCVDPRDTTRSAMVAGTIALSLLPLGFIGGVVAWLWRAHHSDGRDVDATSNGADEGR
jgi:hypothetical protein